MAKIPKAVVAATDTTFAMKAETRNGDIIDGNQPVRRMERGHALPIDEVANTPLSIFASINNLREIARRCLANEPIDRYLGLWLGSALHGYLSHQHQTIEQAFNLRFPKGGVPWWREEAIRIRNASLRDLASRFLRGCNSCQQAQQILTMSTRYAASAWHNDREGPEMPKHYAGTAKEYLWSAFKSGAPMPIGERQLRNVLAD